MSGKVETIGDGRLSFAPLDRAGIAVPMRANVRVGVGDRVDVAVRRDDIEVLRPNAAISTGEQASVPGRVLAIEYQGSFVKVMLDAIADEEFVAYVPERSFFRDPFAVGDVVLAAMIDPGTVRPEEVESNPVRCPDAEMAAEMASLIRSMRSAGDSVGGVIGMRRARRAAGVGRARLR